MLKDLRPRLTFSSVIAMLALFIALGGGVFAVAKGHKSKKINGAKIKPNSLPGDRLTDNSVSGAKLSGPQLVAYALVNGNGTVNPNHSLGITDANIGRQPLASFCFHGLPAFRFATATPSWEMNGVSPAKTVELGFPDGPNGSLVQSDCAGFPGTQVEAVTQQQTNTSNGDSTGFSFRPFFIALYK